MVKLATPVWSPNYGISGYESYRYMYALNKQNVRNIDTKMPASISAGNFNSAEQCVNDSS